MLSFEQSFKEIKDFCGYIEGDESIQAGNGWEGNPQQKKMAEAHGPITMWQRIESEKKFQLQQHELLI